MTDQEVLDILRETGAILDGHFVLTSGRHSDTYVQCARVMEYPGITAKLAKEATSRLPDEMEIDLVVSPAVGGIVFGFATAQALDKRFIFAEREQGAMTLRRAFTIEPGSKVLVAEDVVTTGGSVAEVCEVVRAAGGEVVGVVSLIDRGGERKFSEPFYPLLTLSVDSWEADECKLCADGVEVYSPGSRRLGV